MQLEEAHKLIKKLKEADIILVNERGVQHTFNRLLQRSKWHHVMLYVGQGRTLEVTPRNGAHLCDFLHDLTEKLYREIKILRMTKLTERQRKIIVKDAVKTFVHKKFSWIQYGKIILGRTLELWGKEGNKSMVCKPGHKCNMSSIACSNMVAIAYFENGFQISEKYRPEYVVPRDYEEAEGFKIIVGRKFRTS